MYLKSLLLIHVLGAIVGFGPTFAFAVLGPMGSKLGGPQGLGIMKATLAIAKKMVFPVATVIQPVTGLLLIEEGGYVSTFFDNPWLWGAILIYIANYVIAVGINIPTMDKMITLADEKKADTPEFAAFGARMKRNGPILTLMTLAIVFLMVWKPGLTV